MSAPMFIPVFEAVRWLLRACEILTDQCNLEDMVHESEETVRKQLYGDCKDREAEVDSAARLFARSPELYVPDDCALTRCLWVRACESLHQLSCCQADDVVYVYERSTPTELESPYEALLVPPKIDGNHVLIPVPGIYMSRESLAEHPAYKRHKKNR